MTPSQPAPMAWMIDALNELRRRGAIIVPDGYEPSIYADTLAKYAPAPPAAEAEAVAGDANVLANRLRLCAQNGGQITTELMGLWRDAQTLAARLRSLPRASGEAAVGRMAEALLISFDVRAGGPSHPDGRGRWQWRRPEPSEITAVLLAAQRAEKEGK